MKFRDQWVYVYLLIEFQSTVDRLMALRLMVYVGLLYQQLVDEKKVLPGEPLPPVVPIVLYNGKSPWKAPLDMAELIAESHEELSQYRPSVRYLLLEERSEDPAKLAGMNNLVAVLFRFEQCETRDDFLEVAKALAEWFEDSEHRDSARRILQWVWRLFGKRTKRDEPTDTMLDMQDYGAMLQDKIKEWEQELLEQGIEKGIEKGIAQGEVAVVLRLLREKFGEVPQPLRRRIDTASAEQLLEWAERILTAETIDDVFAG